MITAEAADADSGTVVSVTGCIFAVAVALDRRDDETPSYFADRAKKNCADSEFTILPLFEEEAGTLEVESCR